MAMTYLYAAKEANESGDYCRCVEVAVAGVQSTPHPWV
jgi:hypothetical protein